MKVSVQPGCVGITTRDGKTFDADRRGHVDVPDHYSHEVKNCTTARLGVISDASGTIHIASSDKPERFCPTCHFNPWPWQTQCPRDGAKFVRTEEVLV